MACKGLRDLFMEILLLGRNKHASFPSSAGECVAGCFAAKRKLSQRVFGLFGQRTRVLVGQASCLSHQHFPKNTADRIKPIT